jgi:hypothetical protein
MSQQLHSATEGKFEGTGTAIHPVGEEFVRALAGKDGAALRAVLADPIDFAALTPGRHWTASTPEEVVIEIILGKWFGPDDEIVGVESTSGGSLPDREHLRYRLRVRRDGEDYLVEQQAYYDTAANPMGGEQISWLRVLCSGYRRIDPR